MQYKDSKMFAAGQDAKEISKETKVVDSCFCKNTGNGASFMFDDAHSDISSISRALEYQKAAANLGFEWKNLSDIREKVLEELNEVRDAYDEFLAETRNNSDSLVAENKKTSAYMHVEEEIGDLIFAVVDYARKLGVNPETAITRANEKFHRRFSFVQKRMEENNFPKDFGYIDMMESFWNEAKSKGL